jgi:hypothetical protein
MAYRDQEITGPGCVASSRCSPATCAGAAAPPSWWKGSGRTSSPSTRPRRSRSSSLAPGPSWAPTSSPAHPAATGLPWARTRSTPLLSCSARRRAHLHPHQFRHTFADRDLAGQGQDRRAFPPGLGAVGRSAGSDVRPQVGRGAILPSESLTTDLVLGLASGATLVTQPSSGPMVWQPSVTLL